MKTLIHAYGLFWKSDDVYLGGSRQKGKLLGLTSKRSAPIDFRHQVGIYVLYSDNAIVYIGQAGRSNPTLLNRLNTHRRDHLAGRWDKFSWFGLLRVLKSRELSKTNMRASVALPIVLDQMEALLMTSTEPHLNKQAGRFGKGAHRYYQKRDDRLPPRADQMLRGIWQYVQKQAGK